MPSSIQDSKSLSFNPPNLINTKTNSKVNLELFANKSEESYIERKIYHVIII